MKKIISFVLIIFTVCSLGIGSQAEFDGNEHIVCSAFSSNDTYISLQENYLSYLGIDDVWNAGYTGETPEGRKIRICVIDTGIDTDHPDFYDENGNCVISELSYNASTKTTVADGGMSVIEDGNEHHHGTMVAGVIAAQYGNGVGVAGIAYDAELVVIKCEYVEGAGFKSADDIVEAIRYAVELEGVDIINLSFSANRGGSIDADYRRLFEKASEKGIAVVAASGNNSVSSVSSPACMGGAIAVGALNDNLTARAEYSNYGAEIDVLAPGTVVTPTVKDDGEAGYANGVKGTSFAAPIVSGIIALYKSRYPDATSEQIYSAIKASSVDMGAFGRDNENGYGRINAERMVLGTYGTITLDYGSGLTESISFIKNSFIQENISTPEKEGAVFGGWYTDAGFTDKFNDDIKYKIWDNDITLYAKWLYELKIYRDGALYETYQLTAGSEIPVLPPKLGFEIVYETELPESMPSENIEIWAKYELIPIDFTYVTPNVEKIYDENNVVLSVTAQHALENITYRWYRNGVLIDGEVSSSLTVSGECTDDDGDSYRCVATLENDGETTEKAHVFAVKISAPVPEPTPEPTPTPEPEPTPDSSQSNVGGSEAPSSTTEEYNFSGVIIIGLSLGLIVLMSVMQVRKERR